MKKTILISVCLLFVSGCYSFTETVASWKGRPASELISAWGVPIGTIDIDNGQKVMTWTRNWFDGFSGARGHCRINITITSEGNVGSWTYENCNNNVKVFGYKEPTAEE